MKGNDVTVTVKIQTTFSAHYNIEDFFGGGDIPVFSLVR